jgi:hypothetical protein
MAFALAIAYILLEIRSTLQRPAVVDATSSIRFTCPLGIPEVVPHRGDTFVYYILRAHRIIFCCGFSRAQVLLARLLGAGANSLSMRIRMLGAARIPVLVQPSCRQRTNPHGGSCIDHKPVSQHWYTSTATGWRCQAGTQQVGPNRMLEAEVLIERDQLIR